MQKEGPPRSGNVFKRVAFHLETEIFGIGELGEPALFASVAESDPFILPKEHVVTVDCIIFLSALSSY